MPFPSLAVPVGAVLAAFVALALIVASAADAQEAGPDSLSETYSDWTVQCLTPEGGERRCFMIQSLTRQPNGERVAQLEFAVDGGAMQLAFLAPFGLLLDDGVRLAVDGEELVTLRFRTCLPPGCVVRMTPDDALLAGLRRGDELSVTMTVAQSGESLALNMSLAGFSAAMNRLRALNAN